MHGTSTPRNTTDERHFCRECGTSFEFVGELDNHLQFSHAAPYEAVEPPVEFLEMWRRVRAWRPEPEVDITDLLRAA